MVVNTTMQPIRDFSRRPLRPPTSNHSAISYAEAPKSRGETFVRNGMGKVIRGTNCPFGIELFLINEISRRILIPSCPAAFPWSVRQPASSQNRQRKESRQRKYLQARSGVALPFLVYYERESLTESRLLAVFITWYDIQVTPHSLWRLRHIKPSRTPSHLRKTWRGYGKRSTALRSSTGLNNSSSLATRGTIMFAGASGWFDSLYSSLWRRRRTCQAGERWERQVLRQYTASAYTSISIR